ncbi:MAG: hypothetical protein LBF58_05840 [Deltaproteobacteria bacterium]|jgi:hypothetical protein|nr:hypothetical protein [Deltaproteobacteria bacterium]
MGNGKPIEDVDFFLDIDAVKGVILFPSLGTPAIIEPNGRLTVYLALQKRGFERHTRQGGAEAPGSPASEVLARQVYCQTLLSPWSDRGRDYVDYKKYADELATEAAARKRFYKSHEIVTEKFRQKKYGGFYIGKLEANKEFLVEYYPFGDDDQIPQGPFGVIHKAAVNMYLTEALTDTHPDKPPTDDPNGGPRPEGDENETPAEAPDPGQGGGGSPAQGAGGAPGEDGNESPGEDTASDDGGDQEGDNGDDQKPSDKDEVGYRYVFQFTFCEADNLDLEGLFELMFLYLNYKDYAKAKQNWENKDHWIFDTEGELHEHYLTNPGDELISNTIISELNTKAKKLKSDSLIINTVEFDRFPYMKPKKMQFVKLYDSKPTSVLTQGQKDLNGTPHEDRGGGEKFLHYLSDKSGWFVLSRHPVYISSKDYLDFGVVSDLHLSSRQASFKLVAPQIIHGADVIESPYIGELCHQALETSQRLMNSIGAESDALIVAGDAFDVLRNLDPKVVESKTIELRNADRRGRGALPGGTPGQEGLPGGTPGQEGSPGGTPGQEGSPDEPQKEIRLSTAELWEHMDFKKYKKNAPNYPFYIDALMFMGFMLDYYSVSKKPIFYITGNHEGYEVPYGISPRIFDNNVFVFRANPGIPSDQNLTFYEAALLFGQKYSFLGRVANFKKENLAWAYRWITPWKDCLVNSGKNQNLLLLGWDDDENYLWSTIAGGGSLPRAGSAFTDNQLDLLKRMTDQGDKFNVMASHFTYANFDLDIPLHRQDQDRSGSWFLSLEKTDTGTFEEKRTAVYSQLTGGKVKLTISGHSHRGGAYTCFSDGQIDGLRLSGPGGGQGVNLTEGGRALKSVVPQEQFDSAVACLVSGAGGLYSYQNLNNSELSDIDKPQGMIIKCDQLGNLEKIQYVRDERTVKPRLAVRCDYLWYENSIEMFFKRPENEKQGDIVVEDGRGDGLKYNVYLNPKWLHFLNDERREDDGDLPIERFTLHCVSSIDYGYSGKFVELRIVSGPSFTVRDHKDVPVYRLDCGPVDVIAKLGRGQLLGGALSDEVTLYFLSVHFNKSHRIGRHYDLDSPWCYPVTLSYDRKTIKRKFGRAGELPQYWLINKIPEYDPVAGRG